MSKHYSRLLQASRYQAALAKYVAYIEGRANRQPNIGNGKKRDTSQTLYVKPFATPEASTDLYKCSAGLTAWNTYKATLGGHALDVAGNGINVIKARGFKAARVVIVTGRSADGSVKESHITGSKYLSYGGKSVSLPFGRVNNTDTPLTVFNAIKTELTPVGSTTKVYFSDENF